jgi:THO complex subunit 5
MDTTMAVDENTADYNLDIGSQIKTPHNSRLYQENRNLAKHVQELVEYQLANPKIENATSRAESDREKQVEREIEIRKKRIRAQLAVVKTLYRQSVMKVREEKARTAESRNVNDALILQLHNLKYEEQSLASEISAAQNFE